MSYNETKTGRSISFEDDQNRTAVQYTCDCGYTGIRICNVRDLMRGRCKHCGTPINVYTVLK